MIGITVDETIRTVFCKAAGVALFCEQTLRAKLKELREREP